ncbi:MAG: type II secretion system minor pseudopilin GspK [Pacificimonas sp.]
MSRRGEEGMALITVLLLVAVMAALTVATLATMNRAIAMTANGGAAMQARHDARGAILVAAARLTALREAADGQLTNLGGWQEQPIVVPTDTGSISILPRDGSHCFNLNSVVGDAGPTGVGGGLSPLAVEQFVALAGAVGIAERQARAMALGLVDWIDADPFPIGGGAEDGRYLGYRTPNGPIAHISELMAVNGTSPQAFEALRPYICALPTGATSAMNVNTMTADDVPLIAMLAPGQISLAQARQVLADRPVDGWPDIAGFWADVAALGIQRPSRALRQVATDSDLFDLQIQVTDGDFTVDETVLLQVGGDEPRILSRIWRADG